MFYLNMGTKENQWDIIWISGLVSYQYNNNSSEVFKKDLGMAKKSESKIKEGSYKLVIVESPAKAKTIEKYLGSDFKVIASKGHILDLPQKELGVDLESFEQTLVPIKGKSDTIKDIKTKAKEASMVYLASDPDREGEAIAFHLAKIIGRKDAKRVLFHSITKDTVNKAIQNAIDLDKDKYDAQQARRILDRLIGYKVSPVLWRKLQSGLSAGRVQSVTLKIIVNREKEILNFVPEKWFDIYADLEQSAIKFKAKFFGLNQKDSLTVNDEKTANEIAEKSNGTFKVANIDKKEKIITPQPPFTTSKLQQEASSKLKMKSKQTMQVAQKLYENGYITYMRTDSVRTDDEYLKKVRDYIKVQYGEKYLHKETIVHKQKKAEGSVQDAHEAIRPTNLDNSPDKLKGKLTSEEMALYTLIWNKFVSSQMSSSIVEVTTVTFEAGEEKLCFKSSGSVVLFDGFRKVSAPLAEISKDKNGANTEELSLPKLNIGDELKPTKKPYVVSKESSPPPRYTEGTLVKELEEKGIGRPSTYAAIISNISDKGYVETGKDERFRPTELGFKLCEFLEQHFAVQMDIRFTSKTEELLDEIEEGKAEHVEVLKNFLNGLEKEIKATSTIKDIEGSGFKGKFTPKVTDHKCPICSKPMNEINSKKGKFLGCSGYPDCKKTMPMPSGVNCPECKTGSLSIRKTKNGDPFIGCSGYPNCKHVIWANNDNFNEEAKKLGFKPKKTKGK